MGEQNTNAEEKNYKMIPTPSPPPPPHPQPNINQSYPTYPIPPSFVITIQNGHGIPRTNETI